MANRWNYITSELNKVGIGVLVISSDCDIEFSAAMRKNSHLGHETEHYSELFKCGNNPSPPFYVQDKPHETTKGRNALLKTESSPDLLPIGNHFIRMGHLKTLVDNYDKTTHSLTSTTLNPSDRQNYDSAARICSPKVINMLKLHVEGSAGTAAFLQMMSNSIESFMSKELLPLERIGKMWHVVFIARIWRHWVIKNPKLTLEKNCISRYLYFCYEQNAHSLVKIMLFLKKNDLSHLFVPWLFNSQDCEKFYAKLRSFCPTYSMVATCSVKEAICRVSKIHLLNEISNDAESGFVYPKSDHAIKNSTKYSQFDLPSDDDIFNEILKSKSAAVELAIKLGLLTRKSKSTEFCRCQIAPYVPPHKIKSKVTEEKTISDLKTLHGVSNLKNYADKFLNNEIDKTGPYIEILQGSNKLVVKKTSLCWLLRRETVKLSSDRRLRVRGARKNGMKKSKIKKPNPLAKHSSVKRVSRKIYKR